MKPMSFENRLNLRLFVNIGCMVASTILFVLILITNTSPLPAYTGALAGLFAISLVLFIKNSRLRKSPQRMAQLELLENDERNIFILRVTYTIFSYTSIGVLYVSMLIAGFFSSTVFYTIEALLCVNLILILFIRRMVERKY